MYQNMINIYYLWIRKEGKHLRFWCLKWKQFITFANHQWSPSLETGNNGTLSSSVTVLVSNDSSYDTWRRKWQPTPVFLPEKSHGWRSLVGYSPWDREESDMTERLDFLCFFLHMISKDFSQAMCVSRQTENVTYWKIKTQGTRLPVMAAWQ